MPLYNQGLKPDQYRYFVAKGKSAEQLAAYDVEVTEVAKRTQELLTEYGAQKATLCVGFNMEVMGFEFLNQVPKGWKPALLLSTKPDRSFEVGRSADDKLSLAKMNWNNPHSHLSAGRGRGSNGSWLHTLARKEQDEWIIASPIDRDGQAFVPSEAIEIDLAEYSRRIGCEGTPLSPSDDESFDHPLTREFPFEVKPEDCERYKILFEQAQKVWMTSDPFPVPLEQLSIQDRVREQFPLLKQLGL